MEWSTIRKAETRLVLVRFETVTDKARLGKETRPISWKLLI